MFSRSKINDPAAKSSESRTAAPDKSEAPAAPQAKRGESGGNEYRAPASKAKPPASVLSPDLNVIGNLKTAGDIQIEGNVEGDIRAHLLTVGEGATVRGEVIADDVVVNGRIVGRVRGLKVRLTSTARVEGDIIHKTIAIESGAHFEGSVQRQEDPLNVKGKQQAAAAAAAPQPGQAQQAQGQAAAQQAAQGQQKPRPQPAQGQQQGGSGGSAPKQPAGTGSQG